MGGFFSLAGTASINDIFFVHERGTRVGFWNFAVIVSVNVAPIISGYVIVDLGWRWSFWLLAIAFGVLLGLVIFFMPETTYDRFVPGVATTSSIDNPESITSDEKAELGRARPQGSEDYSQDSPTAATAPRWKKVLDIQNVSFSNQSRIIQILVSPFTLLQHPVIVWACAIWSVTFTWVIIQGAVATQIFAAPPYNLSPTQIGNLVGIAPLIGSALGTVFGGWSCDFISKRLAIRNGGIYEPEFRLWVMVPFLLTTVVGSFGLGMAIHNGLSAIVCGVFLAIVNFAVGVGCTGIVTYSNDVCQHRAGEAFGITMVSYLPLGIPGMILIA
jgi:MFS family permease